MTEFSAVMQAVASSAPQPHVTLTPDWLQGRTTYGGLSGAICLQAAVAMQPELPPLRSAQIAFVGPATGTLQATPTTLRQGKSVVFTSVDCQGEAGLATRALFCFGPSRDIIASHLDIAAPDVETPDAYPNFFIAGIAPTFTQHFDGRLAAGAMPFSKIGNPGMTLWLRHRDEAARGLSGAAAAVALLALADAPPPAAFVHYDRFVPISTVTWQLDLLTDDLSTDDGWWLMDVVCDSAQRGFSAQTMTLWNSRRQPVAVARQTIAMFG